MLSKLTWFEHKDGGTIEIGRRKAKKGDDRHIWVNVWNGNMYNMKAVNIAPLYKTPWTTLTELKQVLLEHLQWRLAGICFQRIKAIAPSKNKETGWCCFTKEEETYLCGSDFSWFNPATMRMEDYNKNTFLLEKRIEFEDSDKVITIRTVVNPHKELLLERGHWLAINRNTNQFSKSGAELKNFVDWVTRSTLGTRAQNLLRTILAICRIPLPVPVALTRHRNPTRICLPKKTTHPQDQHKEKGINGILSFLFFHYRLAQAHP